jgi:hypothetical protein
VNFDIYEPKYNARHAYYKTHLQSNPVSPNKLMNNCKITKMTS